MAETSNQQPPGHLRPQSHHPPAAEWNVADLILVTPTHNRHRRLQLTVRSISLHPAEDTKKGIEECTPSGPCDHPDKVHGLQVRLRRGRDASHRTNPCAECASLLNIWQTPGR